MTITRGSRPVAEIRPAHRRTGRDLREALEGLPPPAAARFGNLPGSQRSRSDGAKRGSQISGTCFSHPAWTVYATAEALRFAGELTCRSAEPFPVLTKEQV